MSYVHIKCPLLPLKKKYTEHIEPIDSKKAGLATFRQDNLVTKNVPEQHELPTCWFAQFL